MLPARTCSVSINDHWQVLYAWIWRPDVFPRGASVLTNSGLRSRREAGSLMTLSEVQAA